MLKKKMNNGGMTLIEVLVSMLVLSIAVVTVMSAFSMATKVNVKSKQSQSVESLMENLLEYAQAGGKDYETDFLASGGVYSRNKVDYVTTETLTKVQQGFNAYKVTVVTDEDPSDYDKDKLNDFNVLQFGGANSNTILIDASVRTNDTDGNGISNLDDAAYEYYYSLYQMALTEHNINHPEDPWDDDEDEDDVIELMSMLIDRELWLVTDYIDSERYMLKAYMKYKLDDAWSKFPETESESDDDELRSFEVMFYMSETYHVPTSSDPAAKCLDQVYVLYSDPLREGDAEGIDVRILDMGLAIDISVFLMNQNGTSNSRYDVAEADTIQEFLSSEDNKTFRVSFRDSDTNAVLLPNSTKIYSSGGSVTTYDADMSVTKKTYASVSTDTEIRVITVTLNIYDLASGDLIESRTITRLQ